LPLQTLIEALLGCGFAKTEQINLQGTY
jgi:hypothetical protein